MLCTAQLKLDTYDKILLCTSVEITHKQKYCVPTMYMYIYARFITYFDFHISILVTKNLPSKNFKKTSILQTTEAYFVKFIHL